jgi:hypothetical protein
MTDFLLTDRPTVLEGPLGALVHAHRNEDSVAQPSSASIVPVSRTSTP